MAALVPAGSSGAAVRRRLLVHGFVQGVGFRPYVLRLAHRVGVSGWIANSLQGAEIEVEGTLDRVEMFGRGLVENLPPPARILDIATSEQGIQGDLGFQIRESHQKGASSALILPDLAVCPDCLRELQDPRDRRYRYPFINCTHCGPRYSIVTSLPYDRARTTMAAFPMCKDCKSEYENPLDRRFHAQPVACPRCGPHLALWNHRGLLLAQRDAALVAAAEHLREGRIVAVKGLGGFQLLAAAGDERAVRRLRARKHREAKPLAVMFPDLTSLSRSCRVAAEEQEELESVAAPIVILDRIAGGGRDEVCESVAPGLNTIGAFLPYTPLHHLLLEAVRGPVVATSGNLSDEPMCTSEVDAKSLLGGIADFFLVHNRPIARHVDDPVVRVLCGQPVVLRRGRGLSPGAVGRAESELPRVLAVGADLKNCPAQAYGRHFLTAQHVGDLENERAFQAFEHVTEDLAALLDQRPVAIACDLHPDSLSGHWADSQKLRVHRVQHHHAHVVSCMVDNGLTEDVLGVSWDGTGYGPDGTIWGGEFLVAGLTHYERFAHLRTFSLAGRDRAARDGRLCALGLLHELHGEAAFNFLPAPLADTFLPDERRNLAIVMRRELGTHRTSSAGRLFDGLAALLGVEYVSRFEGEAACLLEACASSIGPDTPVELPIVGAGSSLGVDWGPLVMELLSRQSHGANRADLARLVHTTLALAITNVALRSGQKRIVLTGGCFQNRLLFECTRQGLESAGLDVYVHRSVPPNDGGIAVGQLAVACALEAAR